MTLVQRMDELIHKLESNDLDTSQACLAQLVEHLICNQRVGGSNPSTGMGL